MKPALISYLSVLEGDKEVTFVIFESKNYDITENDLNSIVNDFYGEGLLDLLESESKKFFKDKSSRSSKKKSRKFL